MHGTAPPPKTECFCLTSEKRRVGPLSPLLYNDIVETIAYAIRLHKQINSYIHEYVNDIKAGMGNIKLPSFIDDMILYE